MKYLVIWSREGEWYYNAKVGAWRIELHKARKYWVSNMYFRKRLVKKGMLSEVCDADEAKLWVSKEFDLFLLSDFCDYYMKDY
jgi:hypothetical protein